MQHPPGQSVSIRTASNVDIGTSISVDEEGSILGYRLDDSTGAEISSEERTEEVAKYEISGLWSIQLKPRVL